MRTLREQLRQKKRGVPFCGSLYTVYVSVLTHRCQLSSCAKHVGELVQVPGTGSGELDVPHLPA